MHLPSWPYNQSNVITKENHLSRFLRAEPVSRQFTWKVTLRRGREESKTEEEPVQACVTEFTIAMATAAQSHKSP